jgi:uncharacterized membrane protein
VKPSRFLAALLLLGYLLLPWSIVQAQAEPAVVRAVLFYSPTCGHCEYVINNVLRPMIEQYGNQLQIAGINVTEQQGQALFMAAMQKYGFESAGVPFLVIGDTVLIGSADIPEKFPDLVKTYLARDGMDWPDIPGLIEVVNPPTVTPENATETSAAEAPTQTGTIQPTPGIAGIATERNHWRTMFARDPAANTLSVLVLLGMLASLAWAVLLPGNKKSASMQIGWARTIPLLCLIGMIVAGYLTYVETHQVEAVCGPVGDCNTVQQSEYARVFGFLPVGVLGLIGYGAILLAWLTARYTGGRLADLAVLFVFVMTVLGTLFSIYLTFLEPFVIGASCVWCLTSAVIMTALMLVSARPARLALLRLRDARTGHAERTRLT